MRALNTFLYEFKHFSRSRAKVVAYLFFVFACIYALYYGFSLHNKQQETIASIEQKKQEDIAKIIGWYEEGKAGPEDRPWIDITTPFWALWNTPTYTIKNPSPLLPLGIGQAEQYGFYKRVTNWSSTYDNDMVEELTNPERLVNGNIDFAFLILFLLPLLFIIFTFNINGLEKDSNFDKLISIQVGHLSEWILPRLTYYTLLLLLTVIALILSVGAINTIDLSYHSNLFSLILLASIYISFWAVIFYFIILKSKGSSSQAFAMISVWLALCVVIPGAVHQYTSIKYPSNLMTDYLDVNRKEAYEVYELAPDSLAKRIVAIFPELTKTKHAQDSLTDEDIVSNTVSAVINEMNKKAIDRIEDQNDKKNNLITASYWFNPISYFQNRWNCIAATDYNAYKNYRANVQNAIDRKTELLVFECWDKKKVDKASYENYIKILK
jgi:ABC-2 type transport system permease protein